MTKENESSKDKLAFLFDVLKRYDHYIATTNFKIGLMMSFVGAIVLGLTIRVMSLAPAQPECNYIYYAAIVASILTIMCSLTAAISLLKAVFPNTKTLDGDKSLIFFGDVASSQNGADGYKLRVEKATPENLLEDLSKQTFIVATIVNEKFKILKISVRIIIYGVIPLLAISLLLQILQGGK